MEPGQLPVRRFLLFCSWSLQERLAKCVPLPVNLPGACCRCKGRRTFRIVNCFCDDYVLTSFFFLWLIALHLHSSITHRSMCPNCNTISSVFADVIWWQATMLSGAETLRIGCTSLPAPSYYLLRVFLPPTEAKVICLAGKLTW